MLHRNAHMFTLVGFEVHCGAVGLDYTRRQRDDRQPLGLRPQTHHERPSGAETVQRGPRASQPAGIRCHNCMIVTGGSAALRDTESQDGAFYF